MGHPHTSPLLMNLVRVDRPCPPLLCFLLQLVLCVRETRGWHRGWSCSCDSMYHSWLLGRPWLGKLSSPLEPFLLRPMLWWTCFFWVFQGGKASSRLTSLRSQSIPEGRHIQNKYTGRQTDRQIDVTVLFCQWALLYAALSHLILQSLSYSTEGLSKATKAPRQSPGPC